MEIWLLVSMVKSSPSLEVQVDKVYRSGLAYFRVGETPHIRERNGKWHEASHLDYHPLLIQFDYESPLAEIGKKFSLVQEADHYVQAITGFERIILLAEVATSNGCSRTLREELDRLLDTRQNDVKDKYLETLQKIPAFDQVKLILGMKIDEIVKYLQSKSDQRYT